MHSIPTKRQVRAEGTDTLKLAHKQSPPGGGGAGEGRGDGAKTSLPEIGRLI